MLHGNRKVSQVWLVVILSFVMVITIMWHTYVALDEIDKNTGYIISTGRAEYIE